jgi:Putative phage serine protease XkdF
VDGVDHPANGLPFLLAKRTGRGEQSSVPVVVRVVKAAPEKRYTLTCVYPALKADAAVAADGWRDFAGPDAIEDAAWSYLRKGGQVGLWHLDGTTGSGEVVESYIYRGPDWTLTAADGSTQTVRKGDWVAGIIWTPEAWDLIKTGKIRGVSMQGTATRRMPSPEALASLRKGSEAAVKVVRRSVKKAVKAQTAGLRKEADALRKRVAKVEKSGPQCGKGHANRPGARYCEKCCQPVGAGIAKSAQVANGVAVDAAREVDLFKRARSADPAIRDKALGQIMAEQGPMAAARVVAGDTTIQDLAKATLAKRDTVAEVQHDRPCKTCKGTGRLRHPRTGKPSKKCPACDGAGMFAAGEVPSAPDPGPNHVEKIARLAARALGGDHDAMGQLISQVGPVIASRVLSGETMTADEFTRGFITAGRAREQAKPGQKPRIPQSTHVIRPSDFTRGPLSAGQQRPPPGSVRPG